MTGCLYLTVWTLKIINPLKTVKEMFSDLIKRKIIMAAFVLCVFVVSANVGASDAQLRLSDRSSSQLGPFPIDGQLKINSDGDVQVTIDGALPTGAQDDAQVDPPADFYDRDTRSEFVFVEGNTKLNFEWRGEGAYSCAGIGTLPGWSGRQDLPPADFLATSAQSQVDLVGGCAVAGGPNRYTAGIRCNNASVSKESNLLDIAAYPNVPAQPPVDCSQRQPPKDWERLTTGGLSCLYRGGPINTADCRVWEGIWPRSFLNSNGASRMVLTNRTSSKNYVAIKFDTRCLADGERGRIIFGSGPATVQEVPVTATISQCPGDFYPQENGCFLSQIEQPLQNDFRWGGPSSGAECVLQPNRVYYLNVIHTLSDAAEINQNVFRPNIRTAASEDEDGNIIPAQPGCAEPPLEPNDPPFRLCGSMITPSQ